jgi:tetratricopeptide (TPR) repeat protein
MRDVPERHRSLRAVFDYSWNLITDQEKAVLRKLSVFCGGFQREAAEKVAGAQLPVLASLVDKSLLRRNPFGSYEMLDILRQYTAQKLDEDHKEKESIRDAHCEYYANFLNQREKDIIGAKQNEILEAIGEGIENIRAAWNWAIERSKIAEIDKLIGGFYSYYDLHAWFREGELTFRSAAESLQAKKSISEVTPVYAKALARHGSCFYRLGSYEKARKLLQESLSIFRELIVKDETAFSLNCLGNIDTVLGNYKKAKEYYEECLRIYKDIDDEKGLVGTLNNLGVVHYYQEEYKEAKQLFEETLGIAKSIGHQKGISMAVGNLGLVAHGQGNYEDAIRLLTEGIDMDRKMGYTIGIANTIHNLGLTYKVIGDYEKAKELYEEGLAMRQEIGDRMGISISLNNLGNLAGVEGNHEEALRLHKESLKIRRELGDKRGVIQSLVLLGDACLEMKAYQKSWEYFYEALNLAHSIKYNIMILPSLYGIAEYFRSQHRMKVGYEILSFLKTCEKEDKDFQNRIHKSLKKIESKLSSKAVAAIKKSVKNKTLEDIVDQVKKEKIS